MIEPLRCLIVDDEIAAHYVLENYIGRMDRLVLAGQCYNALDALNFLHRQPIDLLFLDINMPELTGLELLSSLSYAPRTILTTAYTEFALQGYDFGVTDYLVKPIPFPRFLKAVDRVLAQQPALVGSPTVSAPASVIPTDSIMVKVDADWIRVKLDELLYAQSWGNYVKLFLPGRMLLTPLTTTELESRLPTDQFIRIHKSYIVALNKIERLSGNTLHIGDTDLPVGITFRRELTDRLHK
ncbi:putative response regulatory protein ypdB [Fibrisoma limi BUZ 3]|uniref:Putative response regulatory protein ypdB n=1 Tax=Fibrisoma limi BUZ 3 TaxID=1185876 RepID=I2GG24_9BACT|nr:LytTR family DNA-binding domain-containing protein [Fibrisoma limi]CCH52849.1 putative response regulatory protein ypdB [Fibrisoma limi BUZ 3]